jgi:hypothetical protein
MACLTPRAGNLLHAILELTLVRILVTSRAGTIFESKEWCILQHARFFFRSGSGFMAVAARSCDMSAG